VKAVRQSPWNREHISQELQEAFYGNQLAGLEGLLERHGGISGKTVHGGGEESSVRHKPGLFIQALVYSNYSPT
jgi:hypothetical protein